ncbi:cohesin domain-containing protein [Clostridiaceae bacterium M8S5]|nr:cohesin domain-containing protein [Clostridiaceae bacterium M8S5]
MRRKFEVGIVFTLMLVIVLSMNVFGATVGDQLLNPETGWTRYDDSDSKLTYQNLDAKSNARYYMSTYHVARGTNNSSIKFNFTGSKLRIITNLLNKNQYAENIKIIIDGNTYTFKQGVSSYPSDYYQRIVFEKLDLEDKEHSVVITPENGKDFIFDAIDIDENGGLKEFNEVKKCVLDIEPEKNEIKVNEIVIANLTIDNITEITAEDISIDYDHKKLEFLGFQEVDGVKLVKTVDVGEDGKLRVVTASKGESNIVNAKKTLLKLKFKGKKAGEAVVDITKGKVTDGITLEKDLTQEECDETTITITEPEDVNHSGEFTLLDLGIDARHLGKDPKSDELNKYNTDIVANNAIDEEDLVEIAKQMLANANYVLK